MVNDITKKFKILCSIPIKKIVIFGKFANESFMKQYKNDDFLGC